MLDEDFLYTQPGNDIVSAVLSGDDTILTLSGGQQTTLLGVHLTLSELQARLANVYTDTFVNPDFGGIDPAVGTALADYMFG